MARCPGAFGRNPAVRGRCAYGTYGFLGNRDGGQYAVEHAPACLDVQRGGFFDPSDKKNVAALVLRENRLGIGDTPCQASPTQCLGHRQGLKFLESPCLT